MSDLGSTALLEVHRKAIHGVCLRVLRHPQDAEDATQEVLLEAARQATVLRDPARLEAWLFRVALHTALDLARRRRTRARYEGSVRPAGAEPIGAPIETLHAALAHLPEDERRLLVDHFFHQKTLRELAMPAKCSEVAVWKRLDRAKKRLREALVLAGAGAALAVLDSRAFAIESAGVAKGVLAAGIAVTAASLFFVAGAIRSADRPTPPASAPPLTRAVPERLSTEPSGSASVAPSPERRDPVGVLMPPAARRPYPYRYPPASWRPGLAITLERLRSRRVTIDALNESVSTVLGDIGRQSGLQITIAPPLPEEVLSMKVADIVADGALRLMLGPRDLGFQILADGAIWVDKADRISRTLEDEGRAIQSVLNSLQTIRDRLAKGWNGLDHEFPESRIETKLRETWVVARQEDQTLMARLTNLREQTKLHLIIDAGIHEKVLSGFHEERFLPIEGGSAESQLQRLFGEMDLAHYVTPEQVVLLTTRRRAAEGKRLREEAVAWRAEGRAKLDRRLEGALPSSMPDLVETLERSAGLKVRVSEKVWDCRSEFLIPPGVTVRDALDLIAVAGGFRWAADPDLYIVD